MNQKAQVIFLHKFCSLYFYLITIIFFLLFFALSANSYTQSVSHVIQSQKIDAIVLITDLSGMGPSIAISFYDISGREVSVINKLLMPKGKLRIIVGNYLKVSGCIVVESDNELVLAEYWQYNKDETFSVMPFQYISEDRRCFINCFRQSFCQETFLTLSDPNGNGPMVQMEFYAKTGELIKIIRKMINPYGSLIFKVSDHIDKNIQGKVSIRSFGGGISVHGFQIYNKKRVLILPTYETNRELLMTGLAFGGGYTSDIVIADISAKDNNVRISMIDTNGNLISELDRELPANSTILLNAEEFFGNTEGATIRIKSRYEIMADYWERSQKNDNCFINSFMANPMQLSSPKNESRFSANIIGLSYFIDDDKIEYKVSLFNMGKKPVTVELEFFDIYGKMIGGKKLSIGFEKIVNESINAFFGKNRLGTIIIRNTDSSLITSSRIQNVNNQKLFGKINAISR